MVSTECLAVHQTVYGGLAKVPSMNSDIYAMNLDISYIDNY